MKLPILCTILQISLAWNVEGVADILGPRLKSKEWPWFGDRYSARCPNPNGEWPKCFNLRNSGPESVWERLGLPVDETVETEVEVIFQAKAETVDVAGGNQKLDAVAPFMLNKNGYSIQSRLEKGAEIYRNRPSLKWEAGSDSYTILFMDVGVLRCRGYYYNVAKNGDTLVGHMVWNYEPPANPSDFRNPVAIIVARQSTTEYRHGALLKNLRNAGCVYKGASRTLAENCRNYISGLFAPNAADRIKVVAIQLFYTDGSREYEKYRACTEGLPCHDSIITKFVANVKSQVDKFEGFSFDNVTLTMYVGISIYSQVTQQYHGCCNYTQIKAFRFRPRPGVAMKVPTTLQAYAIQNSYLDVEIGANYIQSKDTNTFYTVLMLEPTEPKLHYFVANLKIQEGLMSDTKKELLAYKVPVPPPSSTRYYIILLYSHKTEINELPSKFQDESGSWDFSVTMMPADFTLMSASVFGAEADFFSAVASVQQGGSCTSYGLQDPETVCPTYTPPFFQSLPAVVISNADSPAAASDPDPTNPDFDYEAAHEFVKLEPMDKVEEDNKEDKAGNHEDVMKLPSTNKASSDVLASIVFSDFCTKVFLSFFILQRFMI